MQFLLSSPLSIFLFLSSDISLSGHSFLSTHCFNRLSHIMFSRTPILSYPEQISMEDNENCNCSTPCEEVHYLSSLSSTVLASTFVVKQLINSSIIKKKASIRYDRRDFSECPTLSFMSVMLGLRQQNWRGQSSRKLDLLAFHVSMSVSDIIAARRYLTDFSIVSNRKVSFNPTRPLTSLSLMFCPATLSIHSVSKWT